MTFLKWIIGVPFVILAVAFAVANGEIIAFAWSPVHEPIETPLYALVIIALALGFFIGSLMTWAGGHGVRKERRAQAKTIKKLETDLNKAQQDVLKTETLHIAERRLDEELY